MKKVIFGAAALLFSGALMAQNTSNSTQSGEDQRVYVRQAGTALMSTVDQSNGSGDGYNLAKIWQRGDQNTSGVTQLGTNNQASVLQGITFPEPNNNTVTVNQGTNNDASLDNKAYVEQHGGNNSQTTITQDGDANEAYSHQDGVMGNVDITQNGSTNASAVWQNFGDYTATGNAATMDQSGTSNNSYAVQNGNGNTLSSTQSGMGNKSDQSQNSIGAAAGNNATVTQSSSGNKAKQVQVGGGNSANAVQHAVTGPGVNNYVEQNQIGNDNTAYSDQDGDGGRVRQDQTGNDNNATVNQYAAGAGNAVYQRQMGSNNTITSGQFGGAGNLASTYQDDLNMGSTSQTGNDNQALLVQKSQGGLGHMASIIQNGDRNMADVLQLGPGGDFSADGEQCDFQAPEILNCPTPLPEISIGAPCTSSSSGSGC
ncbi:hypothetical protein [Lacinutrix algicola]|uniref:hypothetical protein n=1 Tax=Lacinutrix algicola TaxID=342954 RepID=UPI0006E138C2|nr:hypothetical protein [Lacinutrix algicola]